MPSAENVDPSRSSDDQVKKFTEFVFSDSMWHLLSPYLKYTVMKHLEGTFPQNWKFLQFSYILIAKKEQKL
jgi:hypothetical protein